MFLTFGEIAAVSFLKSYIENLKNLNNCDNTEFSKNRDVQNQLFQNLTV